ncbi:hypothetical protein LEP1GSC190_03145 [Leptospira mayottensis 200901116]|nr:hypothetical protein LEP1GSC190_03145 [Leptospira mayottensis 200901116]TGM96714.1 hypothetical protein EHR03_15580 [Leptospira mayottensis]
MCFGFLLFQNSSQLVSPPSELKVAELSHGSLSWGKNPIHRKQYYSLSCLKNFGTLASTKT